MAYKTILAVLDTPQNARPITDYGIALAERFSAHLIGVHAETLAAVPLIAPMEIPDPSAVQILQDAAQKETAEVERIFRQQRPARGFPSSGAVSCRRRATVPIRSWTPPAPSI